jgi:hypothetical protein
MLIMTAIVSRKTPLDGRLEIPASLAERLASLETPLSVSIGDVDESAVVEEMPCTCGKAVSAGVHVHHFLASDLLKSLVPESNVSLAVDVDRGHVHIESEN